MPHPVFHILITIIAIDIIATLWVPKRLYLPVMITALFGSVLPDIDIFFEISTLMGFVLFPEYLFHWGILHSLFFVLSIACCSGLLLLFRQRTIALLIAIIAITSFIHIGMDFSFSFTAESGIKLLFPFSDTEFLLQAQNETLFKWIFISYTMGISVVWLIGKAIIATQPKTHH